MIRVENLTKRYGSFHAIQDVSFEVNRGEVVGFLGPNGAGKSTTMRILCGCLGATSGRALIGDIDVLERPTEVKRRIGYLPEVPPLYTNMKVNDYVRFAATIKGVDDPRKAADQAIGQTGLTKVQGRIIDHLSKGFRQRVGLAQALVHKPDVLVLDEPSSGLDPAQRVEIRALLEELAAGDRTVILSTHVLGEVEKVCERVVIINRGRVVAKDTIDNLTASIQTVRFRVAQADEGLRGRIGHIAGVNGVSVDADGLWAVEAERDVRAEVARAAVECGLLELSMARLEDVFLRYTGEGADAAPRPAEDEVGADSMALDQKEVSA